MERPLPPQREPALPAPPLTAATSPFMVSSLPPDAAGLDQVARQFYERGGAGQMRLLPSSGDQPVNSGVTTVQQIVQVVASTQNNSTPQPTQTTGDLTLGPTGTATGQNFDSYKLRFKGSYWTGSTVAYDVWEIWNLMDTTPGPSPYNILYISHPGAGGIGAVQFATDTVIGQPGTATSTQNFTSFAFDIQGSYWYSPSSKASYCLWEVYNIITPSSGFPINSEMKWYPIFNDGWANCTGDVAFGGPEPSNHYTRWKWTVSLTSQHAACFTHNLTADRNFTFPDVDGTVALTTGVLSNGNVPMFDASGRLVDSGKAASAIGGGGGGGTVTSFSAGNLSPLFTTSVATATTTPALSFALSNASANQVFAGPTSGGAAAPSYRALVSADIPVPLTLTYTGADAEAFIVDTSTSSLNTAPAFKVKLPASGARKGFQIINSTDAIGWASFEFGVGGTAGGPGLALGPGGATARDTNLYRDGAAGTLAIANGSINSALLRVYETTDGTNKSWMDIGFVSGDSRFDIQAQAAGTGTLRDLYLSGATLRLGSNNSTRWIVDSSGNLVANGDGSYNIGAAGANRPARIYASSGITAPDTNTAAATPATTGTMSVNMATATVFTITPTGSCTFNASGGTPGQRVTFYITTSGTSSYTLTWGTNFKVTGTLATGTVSGKVFTVSFVCKDGTEWAEVSRTTAM